MAKNPLQEKIEEADKAKKITDFEKIQSREGDFGQSVGGTGKRAGKGHSADKNQVKNCKPGEKLVNGKCVPLSLEEKKKRLDKKRVVGGKEVSKKEFEQEKRKVKVDTTRSEGLKQAKREKGFISTEDVKQEVASEEARESKLQELGIDEGSFTGEQNQLIAGTIGSQAGGKQLEDEVNRRNEETKKFLSYFGFKPDELGGEAISQTATRGLLALRGATDKVVGKVPFVNDIINGILGGSRDIVKSFEQSLDKRKEDVAKEATKVSANLVSPDIALRNIRNMEISLDEAELAIQREVIVTPSLRTNGAIENIQESFLQQRQAIHTARLQIARHVGADPNAVSN